VGNIRYEDITLEASDYFGEGALISSESRAASVVAMTKGTAFSIDRTTFQKVLGDFSKLIAKSQDRHRLVSFSCRIIHDALVSYHASDVLTWFHLIVGGDQNHKRYELDIRETG
jgi:CRP-like cAMP-binding protein